MAMGDGAGARRALLVAADTYADPGLAALRAPAGDVEALAGVLGDPELGGFQLRELVNRPTEEIKRELETFFDEARLNDLLLLYVSGHGVLSQTRRFYFATASTQLRWLRATAIEDGFVNEVMQHSRARSIVLIVDCCHSGAFAKGLVPKSASGVDVVPRFEGRGRVTLTASTELEYAFEEVTSTAASSELGASQPGSLFTRFLVEGIRTGSADANQDGKISIDELYDYVYARVREHSPHQTPGKGGGGYGDLVIAVSARGPSLPRELREALASPIASVREAAVLELARMKHDADLPMATAIDNALRRVLDDDSLRVRKAAEAALRDSTGSVDPIADRPAVRPAGNATESPAPATDSPPPSSTADVATTARADRSAGAPRRRRAWLAGTGVAVLLAGAITAVLLGGGSSGSSSSDSSSSTIETVTPAAGTTLGSDLTPTYMGACFGGPSEACSVVQYGLSGRPTVSSIDGVVTRWGVRARGRVALQVVQLRSTTAAAVAQSDFETATGSPQHFHTLLPIHKGEFIALLMCPGSRIATADKPGDRDLRWENGFLIGQPRARSDSQSEETEYAFTAVVKPHSGAPVKAPAKDPCP